MNQMHRATPHTREAYDGWVRLWEMIYDCPWPGKDRDVQQWLSAYLDWEEEQ
jgi:hypothetical protein